MKTVILVVSAARNKMSPPKSANYSANCIDMYCSMYGRWQDGQTHFFQKLKDTQVFCDYEF